MLRNVFDLSRLRKVYLSKLIRRIHLVSITGSSISMIGKFLYRDSASSISKVNPMVSRWIKAQFDVLNVSYI